MQELSVTGATLVDQNHQHHHSHDHGGKACCDATKYQLPTIQLKQPAVELVKEYDDTQLLNTVNQIVRMGRYELFCELTDAWKAHRNTMDLHAYDSSGHTLTHWAAKRIDDVRFLQFFMNHTLPAGAEESALHRPTLDDTKMTPVHWLCTVGMNIPSLVIMLEKYPNILELRDGTNCTPLLIAAQHGHVETCAFLIQKGADHRAVDSSRDTATHWAAYKGSELVLGLLSFYDTSPLTQADAYGQTPLHLAALRGHCGTVRYIIQQLRSRNNPRELKDALSMKDSNGRTAYELAVHKQKPAVAEILEQTMHPDFRKYLTVRTCKSWIGLTDAPDESPKLPYYFVVLQIALHFMYQFGVFCPLMNVGGGLLWDYLGMHVLQTIIISGIVYCLHKTKTTNPGRLDSSHPAYQEYRKLYEIAVGGTAHQDIQLCHSCHIAKPLRSKHCRITRACVLGFDHHCPFVGNTVGLYNVRYKTCLMTSSNKLHSVQVVLWLSPAADLVSFEFLGPSMRLLSTHEHNIAQHYDRYPWSGPRFAYLLSRRYAGISHSTHGAESYDQRAFESAQVPVPSQSTTVQPLGPRTVVQLYESNYISRRTVVRIA